MNIGSPSGCVCQGQPNGVECEVSLCLSTKDFLASCSETDIYVSSNEHSLQRQRERGRRDKPSMNILQDLYLLSNVRQHICASMHRSPRDCIFLCTLLFQGSSNHPTPHRYWSARFATIAITPNFDQIFI